MPQIFESPEIRIKPKSTKNPNEKNARVALVAIRILVIRI